MPTGGSPLVPELGTKEEFVSWLGQLKEGEKDKLFKAAKPGARPEGTFEGVMHK